MFYEMDEDKDECYKNFDLKYGGGCAIDKTCCRAELRMGLV
jgi:hypothetical protein